ncbi:MAG: iron-containing alcohol dehydrogenase [Chloroflexi bacterium]|nr:iron-containing alcohol dehydrogenase [Chloroflexota bacterium]
MWFFHSPEIIFGEDSLSYLEELTGDRAFIITDPILHDLGFSERVAAYLRKAGLEIGCFSEVEPDPSDTTIYRALEDVKVFDPQWIIGLGGGSSMDTAKGVWALYENPDLPLDGITPITDMVTGQRARLIAIPTTAGTGAEVTGAVVVTMKEEGFKLAVASPKVVPTIAIVDPSMTLDLPPRLTVETGLDALTQAVEGYITSFNNVYTDGLCLKAIQLVFEYLPRVYVNPHDLEAREHMANAATIAGLGFANSQFASLAHAMGHAFGHVLKQPHGRSVALFLPYTMEYMAKEYELCRYRDIAHALHLPAGHGSEQEAAVALIAAIRNLERQVDQPLTIAELGIDRMTFDTELEQMCDYAIGDGTYVTGVRVPEYDELTQLYEYAYDGRPVDF